MDLTFELSNLCLQRFPLADFGPRFAPGRQVPVVLPPIETDFLSLVERADEQPYTDGQKLDFRQGHFDVAGDHQSFVEDSVQHIDKAGGAVVRWKLEGHAEANITQSSGVKSTPGTNLPRHAERPGGAVVHRQCVAEFYSPWVRS